MESFLPHRRSLASGPFLAAAACFTRAAFCASLLLFCSLNFSTLQAQAYRVDTTLADFNKDGVVDTLLAETSHGSWMSGNDIHWIDGRTQVQNNMGTDFYFGSFWHLIPIPRAFTSPGYEGLQDSLQVQVLGRSLPEKQKPSPALAWLLHATSSHQVLKEGIFDWEVRNMLQWHPSLDTTDAYFLRLDSAQMHTYLESEDEPHGGGWLAYYGHNHRARALFSSEQESRMFQEVVPPTPNSPYRVFQSAHGVMVERSGTFAWVFINDHRATQGSGKLRWPSIQQVYWADSFLCVEQKLPLMNHIRLYVVDIEGDVIKRMRLPDPDRSLKASAWDERNQQLRLDWDSEEGENQESRVISLAEIKAAMQ